MSPLDKEIRKLELNEVVKLSDILDPFNGWKKLMAIIPEDLEDGNCTQVKYSSEDVQLIEQAKEQQQRSCTSILIDEWGTSGKNRPRLSTLKKLLERSELYRAADYVAELLNEPPSERPQQGPSAKVKIPDTDQLLQINKTSVPSPVSSYFHSTNSPSQIEGCPELSTPTSSQLDDLVEVSNSLQEVPTHSCTSIAQDFPSFGDEVVDLPYTSLVEATDNFNDENCLGKGACGTVYLATVNPGNRKIAIKRLHKGGVPGGADRQFRSEITTISTINHSNLLRLLGFSTDGDSLCLVYPYMPNGSLCDLLATEESRRKLPWNLRLKIASGVASGIAHLHSMQPRPLIHRDIKTANVLLDDNMIPKLCDFGLIRVSSDDVTQTTALTTTIIGTSAYMATEAFRGEISVKMDIFSFGVILLELLTGFPPIDDDGPLVDTIFDKTIDSNGTCEFLMDNLVDTTAGDWGGDWKNGVANQFLKVAIDCIAADKKRRPNISTVVERLDEINRHIP